MKVLSIRQSFARMILLTLILMIALSAAMLVVYRSSLMESRQTMVRNQVMTASTLIEAFVLRAKTGELSEAAAQEGAKAAIGSLRYGNNDYFWIHNTDLAMLTHPIKPELNGKSLAQMKDPSGKDLFVEMNKVVAQSGEGFVNYLWSKPGFDEPVPKLSYVKGIKAWGWIVGSGIYIDDVNAAFKASLIELGVFVLIACLLIWFFLRQVSGSIMRQLGGEPSLAVEAAGRIAKGDLSVELAVAPDDRVSLMASMQQMQVELKSALQEITEMVGKAAQGDLTTQIDLSRKQGFVLEMCAALNSLNGNLLRQLGGRPDVAVQAAQQIAKGNLDFEIQLRPDDKESILFAMGTMRDTLGRVVLGVRQQVNAASEGNFSIQQSTDDKLGYAFELAELLNKLNETANDAFTEISASCNALAHSDLSYRIAHSYPGQFGETVANINSTAENLTQTMRSVIEAIGLVSTAASEIATGNQNLSARTERQASSLQETAASMEQFTSIVKNNTENAQNANAKAIGTREKAESSRQVVQASVDTMRAIHLSSSRIHEVVDVINGIAFQTNILALNAAVEAARAGESGRGFAVVATEVRALAQRAGQAAKEIAQLIAETISTVEVGSRHAESAGDAMDMIGQSIAQVTAIMSEISNASNEQALGIEQVSLAVNSMDETTQQNAALVEEAAAAAESLAEQAEILKELVSNFRLPGTGRKHQISLVPSRQPLPQLAYS